MNWFISCITKNYANFSGRARRQEYWMFNLFLLLFWFIIIFIGSLGQTLSGIMFTIFCISVFAFFIPNLAVTVRRLHDTDKSGWWFLISLIPFGGIILLIFMCIDSTPGSNQYGDNPKGL